MNRQQEQLRVEIAEFVHTTRDAYLVRAKGADAAVWVPASQVHSTTKRMDGTGHMMVTPWVARKKGLL